MSGSSPLARIKYLYLYPVKSMRGVAVNAAHLGLNGFYGDRRYAFVRQARAASDGFPWATGRVKPQMILNIARMEGTPTHDEDARVFVQTRAGDEYAVDDPRLVEAVAREFGQPVFLLKNKRGNYDSQHVSIFSLSTLRALETESESPIDHRQFRANIYIEPMSGIPFEENEWVGRMLRIGDGAVMGITKKDSRCMMINLNPDSAVQNPRVLRAVARNHNEEAGIYANVIQPGIVRVGDVVQLI
jgi:uncharacterized protein YcbX